VVSAIADILQNWVLEISKHPDRKRTYMSIETKDDFLVLLMSESDEFRKRVARVSQPAESIFRSIDTGHRSRNIQKALQRIMVKEFISIREAHLLLCCSDGHIRNLVDKAGRRRLHIPSLFSIWMVSRFFHRVKLLELAQSNQSKSYEPYRSSFFKLGVNLNFHPSDA